MRHHVIVSFGKDNELEFRFASEDLAGTTADEARRWFDREFVELECEVATPVGKILLADRILSVAKYAGERRFREQRDWAEQFARHAARLLGRELIRVDIANYAIGY
jgi:hypothetical protein